MNSCSRLFKIMFLTILLSACSHQTIQDKDTNDILIIDSSSESVAISHDNYNYLEKSNDILDGTVSFSQIKAFIANDEFIHEIIVQDEPFIYLKVPSDKDYISGKIVYENSTDEPMTVRSLFLQGDEIAEVKLSTSGEWSSTIEYEVAPYTSASLDVDVKWIEEGMQELTFFPIDYSSDPIRYNGGSFSTYRFFVHSKDISISDTILKNQSFNLDLSDLNQEVNFFPVPTWLDKDKKELIYSIDNNQIVIENPISFVKLAGIPYNTEIDLLLVDEYGNTNIIKKDIFLKENEEAIISIESELKDISIEDRKYFLMVINNRGEEILADLKALALNKKPFFTSYQGVIEVYPLEEG